MLFNALIRIIKSESRDIAHLFANRWENLLNLRILPDEPLTFIKKCVGQRRVYWTWHVNMRLGKRFISRDMILGTVDSYEIIESYPEDKYYPSYLLYACHGSEVFHVLFAADVSEENVRVVTAYRPRPEEWSEDLKRRKKS